MKHPPGCKCGILNHPSGMDDAVEVALFQDHRFAFFYWLRWTKKLGRERNPPALISLDWHEDTCAPEEDECNELAALKQEDPREVALFCWERLNPLNDSHILAAAYINLIGDIYIVRKQNSSADDVFEDEQKRQHHIRYFDTIEGLMAKLRQEQVERVFFDIDLDYFTESSDANGGGCNVMLVADEIIRSILEPDSEFLVWVFERFAGMTIATEPEFCGGLINSNHLLSLISESLFEPQILADDMNWKHLPKN